MISNLLTTTFRHLRRNQRYTLINVSGLAIVFATVAILGFFIFYERTYDQHFSDADHLYRIHTQWDGGRILAATPPPLAVTIMEDIPEIEAATRIFKRNDFTLRSSDTSRLQQEKNIYFADANFFEVFRDQIVHGDPDGALTAPGAIVLTVSAARKYFPTFELHEIPGKQLSSGEGRRSLKITAVIKDVPKRSHFDYNALVSSATIPWMRDNTGWSWSVMYTYFISDASSAILESKMAKLVVDRVYPYFNYDPAIHTQEVFAFTIMPITAIHLHSSFLREMKTNGSILYVQVFSLAAGLLLVLGIANYINLSTAQSLTRSHEFGMRKTLGSGARSLVMLVFLESIILSFCAGLLSLGMIELFAVFASPAMDLKTFHDLSLLPSIGFILLGALVVGIIAAVFPSTQAIRLAGTNMRRQQGKVRSRWVRQVLVIVQFFVTSSLLIGAGVVLRQLQYIQSMNLGFSKENVVVIENDRQVMHKSSFVESLKAQSAVIDASFATTLPAQSAFMIRDVSVEDGSFHDGMRWMQSDDNYAGTLGLTVVSGRFFDRNIASDSAAVVINEEAARTLGFDQPIGQIAYINRGENDEVKVHVIGVVKDFNSESFYQGIKPLVISYLGNSPFKDYIAVRLLGHPAKGLMQVEKVWRTHQPDTEFSYYFLDERFDALFASEERMAKLFWLFGAIALVVGCMGLYGLASFSMQLRIREMGIRKVLGSSGLSLFVLLSQRFLALALGGFVVAVPFLWLAMNSWLQRFVFRTDFPILIIPLVAFIVLLVSLAAVSSQAIRIIRLNPTISLKDD